MKFNNTTITEQSIQAARQWFIDNQDACISGALDGSLGLASHVDVGEYIEQCEQRKADIAAGKSDHTFAFMQRAYYLQTGESVALLP